jgi:pSer/pThr/pTyr-binding forkhead associated (FHA) protein
MIDRTTSFTCPNGHQSTEPDFCSRCAAPIAASDPASASAEACPECGTPRAVGARFCEACRHDFRSRDPAPAGPKLWVAVQVDATLAPQPDSDGIGPAEHSEQLFQLDLAEILVGRRNDGEPAQVEIQIADSGVSRRHLSFQRHPDGRYTVTDLDSTNGTWLNDVELPGGVETQIRPGDELTIGEWTRLSIRSR